MYFCLCWWLLIKNFAACSIALISAWKMLVSWGRLIDSVCISLSLPICITKPAPVPSFVLLPSVYTFICVSLGGLVPRRGLILIM